MIMCSVVINFRHPQPTCNTSVFKIVHIVQKQAYQFAMGNHPVSIAVDRLATLWRSSASDIEFQIPKNCSAFQKKYNSVQQSIEQIFILDELLAGLYVTVTFRYA